MKRIIKKNAGFTLIELMIVVAIIGILAAIAIPNFIRYQLKSKEAEAKTVIGGIRTSEEAFRGEADLYAPVGVNGGPPGTVKNIWSDDACPDTCGKGLLSINCTSYNCIGYKPTGPVYFEYTTNAYGDAATTPEFATEARSNLDADGNLNHNFYVTRNDPLSAASVQDCNGTITVGAQPELWGEIYDCDPNFY